MSIQIFNTQTKKKEELKPLEPGHVRMYVCGPTVYDLLHIGNFRGAIFFNLVRNWLEARGNKVTFVYNYTDVDDKIINRANKDGVTAMDIANKYIAEFEKDFNALDLKKHDHNPRVSDFINEIVGTVQKLIDNKHAYVVNGEVLYSIKSFEAYGKLSGKTIDDLVAGGSERGDMSRQKQHALDFTLWKPAKPGEPKWPSPWGEGRPGWHIECSAMASKLLGDSFDIHGGGIDLIFPHHENEIAQSEGASHKPFVSLWMHNNFLNFGAHKMSKSLGNVMHGRTFMQTFNPEILKYMMLSAHYRSPVDFSQDQIDHAIHGLARVYSALSFADRLTAKAQEAGIDGAAASKGPLDEVIQKARESIAVSLDDDFNTPEVFARIFEVVRVFNSQNRLGAKVTPAVARSAVVFAEFVKSQGQLMSLYQKPAPEFLTVLDDMLLRLKNLNRGEIDQLVANRSTARASKDFAKSDELRDQLVKMGIAVQDTPEGSVWEVQK